MQSQEFGSRDAVASAMTAARREAEAHLRLVRQLDAQYGDTIGDRYWAQTGAAERRAPRDEPFIAEYLTTRARAEAHWHDWSASPGSVPRQTYMRAHREAFKTHLGLAIEVLTPAEKFRFKGTDELFGWIVSGMQPLFVDGEAVPLDGVIEPRYLARHSS